MPTPRRKHTNSDHRVQSAHPEWEPVWQGDGEASAEIVAGGVAAAGIPTRTMGAQQVPTGYPHAFQRDTWAVFVPSSRAEAAGELLRTRGDETSIVSGSEDISSEQRATLRLVLILAVYVGIPAVILGSVYAILD